MCLSVRKGLTTFELSLITRLGDITKFIFRLIVVSFLLFLAPFPLSSFSFFLILPYHSFLFTLSPSLLTSSFSPIEIRSLFPSPSSMACIYTCICIDACTLRARARKNLFIIFITLHTYVYIHTRLFCMHLALHPQVHIRTYFFLVSRFRIRKIQ